MIDRDRYSSVETGPAVHTRVKGSRFEAQAFRADDDASAERALAEVRRRHHDATHHCSARRLGPPVRATEHADDDGEPSGTAGAPILARITSAHLFDVLVIVTRWFGGTKLGTGGLVRAYSDSAAAALDVAPRREIRCELRFILECDWSDLGAVESVLSRAGDDVRCSRAFDGGSPRLELHVLRGKADALRTDLRDATANRSRLRSID